MNNTRFKIVKFYGDTVTGTLRKEPNQNAQARRNARRRDRKMAPILLDRAVRHFERKAAEALWGDWTKNVPGLHQA